MDEWKHESDGEPDETRHDVSGHGGAKGLPAEKPQARDTEEGRDEAKLLRRLQLMMNMVMGVIAQDNSLTYDEAATMVADARTAALTMFPGKELAYDLIWKPRFQRLMQERFRLV